MARLGADPEDLDRLAEQFAAGKTSLSNASSGLSSRLNSTSWHGPDADSFRTWWSRNGSRNLSSASYYMGSLADYVTQQAQEQRWASQGAGHRMSWPGRPPHWTDPVHPSLRRGPTGQGNWTNNGGGSQGDPVDSATGAMWFVETDAVLATSGRSALTLERTHHGWFDDSLSFGYGWVSILDSHLVRNGDLVGVLAPDGSFVQFTDTGDELVPIVGVTATLAETATGFKLTAADGQVLTYASTGILQNVGTATDLGFTFGATNGHIDSIRQPGVDEIAVVRDGDGRITSIGDLCSFTYDDGGHLVESANDEGVAKYEWDDRHRVVHQWDRRGRTVVQTRFDDHGRVTGQLDQRGEAYSFSWDEATGRSVMTDPLGNEWTDRYMDGVLVERTNPLGTGVGYERDGLKMVAQTGPDGVRRTSEIAQPLDSEIVDGRLARLGDMEFQYDDSDLLVGISQEDSHIELVRDPEYPSRVLKMLDASGEESTCDYNEDGQLIGLTGPEGQASFGFEGDQISSVELSTEAHHFRLWEEDGTLRREVDGVETIISSSDDEGRVAQIFDELGRPQSFEYDEWDRLTSTKGPAGEQTSYSYDVFDRLSGRTDSVNRELSIERDAAQRMIGVVTEDGAHFGFDLDSMGRLVGITTGEERELAYERNQDGKVMSVIGRDVSRELLYDDDGQLVSLSSDDDQTSLIYDVSGNVVRIESSTCGDIGYEYDLDGAVTAKIVNEARTDIGYLGSLEANYKSEVGEVTVTADSEDVLTLRLPNGVNSKATWSDGRLASLEATGPNGPLWSETYQLDATGNVEAVESLDSRWDFEYDGRDMITSARLQGAESRDLSWEWNSVGTRLNKTFDGNEHRSGLDEHSRIVRVESAETAHEIEYGDAGRVISSGVWKYRYDGEGNLVEASSSSCTVSHSYDALSNRIRTVEAAQDGSIVRDISIGWDLSTVLPEPVLAVDNLTGRRQIYQYGPMGAPLCMYSADAPGDARWFITDTHGTIRVVTDDQANVVGSRTYDPFGDVLSEHGQFDTGLLQLGYIGAIQDESTGLCHLRERDYDPTLGRFLSPDPELMPMGMSVITGYAYAFNCPVALSDPSGLWPGQGTFNKAKSAAGSAINKVRDVGGAVVDRAKDVAGSAVRSSTRFVKRAVHGYARAAAWVGGKTFAAGKWIFQHAGAIATGLGVVALVAGIAVAAGVSSPVIAGVAAVALVAAKVMTVVSMFDDGAQFLAGLLVGDMSMMLEGGLGLVLSGIAFLLPGSKLVTKNVVKWIRRINPAVPMWVLRGTINLVNGMVDDILGVGFDAAGWLLKWVLPFDPEDVPLAPKPM